MLNSVLLYSDLVIAKLNHHGFQLCLVVTLEKYLIQFFFFLTFDTEYDNFGEETLYLCLSGTWQKVARD